MGEGDVRVRPTVSDNLKDLENFEAFDIKVEIKHQQDPVWRKADVPSFITFFRRVIDDEQEAIFKNMEARDDRKGLPVQ
jgi:hypothetical protein